MSRPKEFDAKVMQWLPLMRQLAGRLVAKKQDREDIVQDVIATALHRWASFKPEGSMPKWLSFILRERIRSKRECEPSMVDIEAIRERCAPSSQEDAAELSRVMGALDGMEPSVREAVLLTAAGYDHAPIGERHGVTRQAISMRVQRARRQLVAA